MIKRIVCFGVDIGGTKIALTVGEKSERGVQIVQKLQFETVPGSPEANIEKICCILRKFTEIYGRPEAIGISCGGPLNIKTGVILSPPNLPGWDEVSIVKHLQEEFQVPVAIENDADACALAEFRYGAGIGTKNMLFLTFGTGLGAGLILNGRIYRGATGCAGEVGHIRLAQDGPVGYFKAGSFEGFCSGGGLRQQAQKAVQDSLANGTVTPWIQSKMSIAAISAKDLADAAYANDPVAKAVMLQCGQKLGEGLSVLIDILNPDMIVLGSIFVHCESLLRQPMQETIAREALRQSAQHCKIVPAALGEQLGDYAALGVAFNCLPL